jgi:hypothetical protein
MNSNYKIDSNLIFAVLNSGVDEKVRVIRWGRDASVMLEWSEESKLNSRGRNASV